MKNLVFVPNIYEPKLDLIQTEIAIKKIKDHFERELAENLNITRVSAMCNVSCI